MNPYRVLAEVPGQIKRWRAGATALASSARCQVRRHLVKLQRSTAIRRRLILAWLLPWPLRVLVRRRHSLAYLSTVAMKRHLQAQGIRDEPFISRAYERLRVALSSSHMLLPLFLIALALFVGVGYGMGKTQQPILNLPTATWARFLEALWQVHASFAALTFVVVAFVYEAVQQHSGRPDVFALYLQRSHIVPVVALGLALVVSIGASALMAQNTADAMVQAIVSLRLTIPDGEFVLAQSMATAQSRLVGDLGVLSAGLFTVFVVCTACTLRSVLAMLDPSWLRLARLRLFASKIQHELRLELKHRFANSHLWDVCNGVGVAFPEPWWHASRYMPLAPARAGQVVDIDTGLLESAVKSLTMAPRRPHQPWPRIYIAKGLGDHVGTAHPHLALGLPSDAGNLAWKLLHGAFTVRGLPVQRSSTISVLRGLVQEGHAAIRDANVVALQEVVSTCLDLTEVLVGEQLALERAPADPRFLFPGMIYNPISQLIDGIASLSVAALSSRSQDLTELGLSLPANIAVAARKVGSLQLFEYGMVLVRSAYRGILRSALDKETERRWITERTVDMVSSIVQDLSLWSDLDQMPPDPDAIRTAATQLLLCIQALNSLLRMALDASDAIAIRGFARALGEVLENTAFDPDEARRLAGRIRDEQVEERDGTDGQSEPATECALLEEARRLWELRQAAWFGLCAWALERYGAGKARADVAAFLVKATSTALGTVSRLAHTYAEVVRLRELIEDPLNWGQWDEATMEDIPFGDPDHEAGMWLVKAYILIGSWLFGRSPAPITGHTNPTVIADVSRPRVTKLWRDLAGSATRWEAVLPGIDAECVGRFHAQHVPPSAPSKA